MARARDVLCVSLMRLVLPLLFCALSLLSSTASASAPKIDASCDGFPVLTARHVAAQYAALARDRLNELGKLDNAARKNAWTAGPEKRWFGAYTRSRWEVARRVMSTAAAVLVSPNLTIRCDRNYENWAKTFADRFLGGPTLYTIVLGKPWLFGKLGLSALQLAGERQQTLVHEAAHHGGANRGEFLGRSGVEPALRRAALHPAIAARTAENHGYFAICRASASPACVP